jgi:hypothetical protein
MATVAIALSPTARSAIAAPLKQAAPRQTVTGHYVCKYLNVTDTLNVLLLPKGQVKFDLIALLKAGDEMRNGEVQGIAALKGNSAVYNQDSCKVTIKFAGNKAEVKVENAEACGFGAFVTADGSYLKANGRTPKFDF